MRPAAVLCAALAACVWQAAAVHASALAPEAMLRSAAEAHAKGRVQEAEAQYKAILRDGPHDRAAASSLLGILYCQTQRPDEGARLLEGAPASDWVAHEYMGGVYMLLARRLTSSNAPGQDRQRLRALKLASREFNLSLSHYTPQPTPTYIQSLFAKERRVVYRAYGDALAWSGDPAAALAVFERGVSEGLWPHGPHCRPAKSRPVVGIPLHTQPARALFPHVALKLESALATIEREFEALNVEEGVWAQESAGLHSHGSTGAWHVLLLIVNGKQQRGCTYMPQTCALLMSLPSVRYLRDGQVKLSRIASGTHVLPHAGPTNLRLRLQLPIRLQQAGNSRIRVGLQGWRTWTMGESFVFDESCEHEVRVNGSEPRTVLLVDFANPLLLEQQDYLNVAMRVSEADRQSDIGQAADTVRAAEEWNQAQAHWRAQQQARLESTEL